MNIALMAGLGLIGSYITNNNNTNNNNTIIQFNTHNNPYQVS